MSKIDRLVQLAGVAVKPIKAGMDLVPMVIDPDRPTSALRPEPCFVSNEDYGFAHPLCNGVVVNTRQRRETSRGMRTPPPANASRYSQITVESKIVSPASLPGPITPVAMCQRLSAVIAEPPHASKAKCKEQQAQREFANVRQKRWSASCSSGRWLFRR